MNSSASVAAIFDLDGTLFDGHVWLAVSEYQKRNRVNRRWLYLYLLSHLPLWYLHKLGLIGAERARYVWARNMSWSLRGFDQAQADAMFNWVTDEYLMPLLRWDVAERLRYHQSKGHCTVLLSGAFEDLLAIVGHRLGVQEVLGTRLAQRDGRYTGGARLPICQGRGKLQRLQAFISEPGRAIDLQASYAYADSLTDRPLLEAVGHPVAVYPEQELADLASRQGWPVLGIVS